MTGVVGRVWGWVSPVVSYRPWGSSAVSDKATKDCAADEGQKTGGWGWSGLTSWVWRGHKAKTVQAKLVEEYYFEAEEKLQPMEIEDLGAGRQELGAAEAQRPPRWWSRILPPYFFWSGKTEPGGLRRRKCVGWNQGAWDSDNDGELSDYGTPPPSPTPSSPLSSPFRLFAQSWQGDILPEHYEICFNFLRHLFDLFVVGFLWTVSPPTKVILEVLGVQGGLKLWLHGMAMFFVSTVGMAGLLWLVQEYLPEFALIYGIVQAVVISVSVRQSVLLGGEEEEEKEEEKEKQQQQQQQQEEEEEKKEKEKKEKEKKEKEKKKEAEVLKDTREIKEVPVISKKRYLTAKERLCFEAVGI